MNKRVPDSFFMNRALVWNAFIHVVKSNQLYF
jgi:hypothetical protein